jgi:hypothetical protein
MLPEKPPPATPEAPIVIADVAGAALAFTRRPWNTILFKVPPPRLKVAVNVFPDWVRLVDGQVKVPPPPAVQPVPVPPVTVATAETSRTPVELLAAVKGTSEVRTTVRELAVPVQLAAAAFESVILGRSSVVPSTEIVGVDAGVIVVQVAI